MSGLHPTEQLHTTGNKLRFLKKLLCRENYKYIKYRPQMKNNKEKITIFKHVSDTVGNKIVNKEGWLKMKLPNVIEKFDISSTSWFCSSLYCVLTLKSNSYLSKQPTLMSIFS